MQGRKRLGRKKRRKGLSKKESLYGILLAVVIVSIFFIYFSLRSPSNQTNGTFQFKAAIVDHLSLFEPNPTFNQTASTILEEAGFTVDYYPWDEVDVEFYRRLPKGGYGLLILRVHSAASPLPNVVLFTSEEYDEGEHQYEQWYDRVGIVSVYEQTGPYYFGILPRFVEKSMEGKFQDTIIIMMGCDGLKYDDMAKAFIKKGAKAYISWDGPVSTNHTDQATMQLLEHLITENQRIKEAVDEISRDPSHDSKLDYYPKNLEIDNYVAPEPKSNLTTSVAEINEKIGKLKDEHTHDKNYEESEKTSIK